ncbi:hypothetical protein ACTMU2_07750 [Cupriavidus basilensis]
MAQLSGVLEQHGDQWVPSANAQGLAFDPAFLRDHRHAAAHRRPHAGTRRLRSPLSSSRSPRRA